MYPLTDKKIITWVKRLLDITFILFLFSALNLATIPITIPYTMAIGIAVILAHMWIDEEEAFEEMNDMYLMDISGFDSFRYEQE